MWLLTEEENMVSILLLSSVVEEENMVSILLLSSVVTDWGGEYGQYLAITCFASLATHWRSYHVQTCMYLLPLYVY